MNNPQSIPTLLGISSWIGACGYVEYPQIFGKVTHVLDWIKRKTSKYRKFCHTKNFKELKENYSSLISFGSRFNLHRIDP